MTLVKPVTCQHCKGKGFGSWKPQGGLCYSCTGTGLVEGDREAIRAARAHAGLVGAFLQAAARNRAYPGASLLQVRDPERFQRAMDAFAVGREGVWESLRAYFRSEILSRRP